MVVDQESEEILGKCFQKVGKHCMWKQGIVYKAFHFILLHKLVKLLCKTGEEDVYVLITI